MGGYGVVGFGQDNIMLTWGQSGQSPCEVMLVAAIITSPDLRTLILIIILLDFFSKKYHIYHTSFIYRGLKGDRCGDRCDR